MIRGIIFDINGTLSDIWTDEESLDVYRVVSNFLDYQGVKISPEKLKKLYFEINKRQRTDSDEPYPEFDIVALFKTMTDKNATSFFNDLPKKKRKLLPAITAEVFRAASRRRLKLYPDVKKTLDALRKKYKLASVSDGQSAWARAELASVGLDGCFHPFIVSGDYGYRKPEYCVGFSRFLFFQTFFNRLDCRGQLPECRDFGIGARAAVFLFALI